MELVWEKPIIIFHKERLEKPQRKAFLVVKARGLEISSVKEGAKFKGSTNDFFFFMGDIDYISSKEEHLIGMFCAGLKTKEMFSAKLGHD